MRIKAITVIQCPFCQTQHVPNTIFCSECGVYLLETEELGTDPFDGEVARWLGEADDSQLRAGDLHTTEPLTIRLHIGKGNQARELEVSLVKPVHLGRNDPAQDTYPEIDLTDSLAREYGVSRKHACVFQRGKAVVVEDLGSVNGTLLNGKRLAPYIPAPLKDGDRLQLGKLLIEVSLVS